MGGIDLAGPCASQEAAHLTAVSVLKKKVHFLLKHGS